MLFYTKSNLICTYLEKKRWRDEQVSGKKFSDESLNNINHAIIVLPVDKHSPIAMIRCTKVHLVMIKCMWGCCLHQYFPGMQLHVFRHSWSSPAASSSVIPSQLNCGPHTRTLLKGQRTFNTRYALLHRLIIKHFLNVNQLKSNIFILTTMYYTTLCHNINTLKASSFYPYIFPTILYNCRFIGLLYAVVSTGAY